MTDLELVEQHLTQDLEQRMEGGEDCPDCDGRGSGRLVSQGCGVRVWCSGPPCEPCHGSGRSPYITAAEEALAAVQRERQRVERLRTWVENRCKGPLSQSDSSYDRGFRSGIRKALEKYDAAPATEARAKKEPSDAN